MKKFLLSCGLLAGALCANATVYTIYDASAKGTPWEKEGTGYTMTVTAEGKSFKLSSDQNTSTTTLLDPGTSDQWRIYKGSKITISSSDMVMKGIRLTFDGSKYAVEGTLSDGWNGDINDLIYILGNASGSKEMTLTADAAQIRVSKIEVSDELFNNDTPTPPSDETILDVANAADVQGDLYEEEKNEDGSVKSGKRVQPLESLEIDGYIFTFSKGASGKTDPALYWPTSTSTNGKMSIRIYNGNTMTITAPAGKTFTSLTTIPDNSSDETSVYAGEEVNTMTYTATATLRINTIKVGTGEVEIPQPKDAFYSGLETNADDWTLDEGEVPEGLNFVWTYDSKYGIKASAYYNNVRYASDIWAVSPVIDLSEAESAELKFSQAANYLSGNFDMISTAVREENGEWNTISVNPLPSGNSWTYVDSSAILNDFVGKKIQIGFNYKSTDEIAATWEIKNLSVVGTTATAVNEVAIENGSAEYFTLQGVKVNNPENGIFIRIQNGKASKVLVK